MSFHFLERDLIYSGLVHSNPCLDNLPSSSSYYTSASMAVVERDILVEGTIVNPSPGPTGLGSEETTNSPQLNYDVNEDGRQIHKTYHIHNFGTVYMDSLNSHSVTMENCANNDVRRVTYNCPKIIMDCELNSDNIIHSQSHAAFNGLPTDTPDSPHTRITYTSFYVDCVMMFSWASLAVACLAFFIMNFSWLSSCCIEERT
ncbi:hypothetical protein BYT27DRAFT_7254804 [Phlegmacium glaucopus]|nr:hypothetical protein BYT27DRAFT_7254804 [Phlegmacium glaucopus]